MKILVLGGTGFIGKSVSKSLDNFEIISIGSNFHNFKTKPDDNLFDKDYDVIVNCCGWYGGIPFNRTHGEKILEINSLINYNIGQLVQKINPNRYIKIVSGCVYPSVSGKMTEDLALGSSDYHETVKWSATANKNDIEFLQQSDLNYDILLVTNTYGPGEHLSFEKSHIVGSVINKFLQAENSITMFGTGAARRDFLFSEDLGEIIKKMITHTTCAKDIYNVSTGNTHTIKEVVELIKKELGPAIKLTWGDSKDDGVLEKSLDNKKLINFIGPFDFTPIENGISQTINYFK